jgi:hypothetical protein
MQWRRFHTALGTGFLLLAVLTGVSGGGQRDEPAGTTAESPGTESEQAGVGTQSGRIEFFAGEVLVDGKTPETGDVLARGSVLRTGSDGLVDIVFGNGNALRIEENTELSLDLVDPSVGLDVRRGTVAAVFQGLETIGSGRDDTFRIQTPSTVAGVRGTAFFIRIEDADRTYVCTCHGILEFAESGLTVRAARHAATRFTRANGEVTAEKAPELYHDTDSLNAVADVAGVTIAWGEEP